MASQDIDRSGSYQTPGFFQHTPLTQNEHSIRLVQISPDLSAHGMVQCSLQHTLLEKEFIKGASAGKEKPAVYSCLSYTWGDHTKDTNILINGKLFRVHRNLSEFLYAARKHISLNDGLLFPSLEASLSRSAKLGRLVQPLFWIDAVCIDQENIAERNHQVQQMGMIYSRAKLVIIWLGQDPLIDTAMQIIEKARLSLRLEVQAMSDIFTSLDYWYRAWITQEIVLADYPLIFVDSGLYDMIWQARKSKFLSSQSLRVFEGYNRLVWTMEARRELSVLAALHHLGGNRGCSNPHDRIYSVLALCTTGNDIKVDYTLTAEQLMRQVLGACGSSLCLCSINLIAERLDVPDRTARVDYVPYMQFETAAGLDLAVGSKSVTCCRCAQMLPSSWSERSGSVLCMQEICPETWGHMMASTDCKPQDDSPRVIATYATYSSADMVMADVLGVQVTTTAPSGTKRWHMTYEALLQIAKYERKGLRPWQIQLCYDGYPEHSSRPRPVRCAELR